MFDAVSGSIDVVFRIAFAVLTVAAIATLARYLARRNRSNGQPTAKERRAASAKDWDRKMILFQLYQDLGGDQDTVTWLVRTEPTMKHNPGPRAKAHLAYADYRMSGGGLSFIDWAFRQDQTPSAPVPPLSKPIPAARQGEPATRVPPQPSGEPPGADIERRLATVEGLRERGAITEAERAARRKAILDET